MMRRASVLVLLLLARDAFADCACPSTASSKTMLLSTDTLVVCGFEERRENTVLVASEFEIFRCDSDHPMLELGAERTAKIEYRDGALHVVEIDHWPFGKKWEWIDVPTFAWRIEPHAERAEVVRLPLTKPQVRAEEIRSMLISYRRALEQHEVIDEEVVARLFTAAVAGDAEAERSFLQMTGLDGHAAEVYGAAIALYRTHVKKENLP